jgi:uncharacterized repeat protein (TIGR03943 family)
VVAALSAAGGTITMLVGAVLLRLTVTDTYRRYVKGGLGLWLTIAGIAIVLLGLVTIVRAIRRSQPGHEHDHGIGVGWLLLAPIAALLLVAPPTLGSYGVGRAANVNIKAGAGVFKPLRRGAEPLELSLLEFSQRAYDHRGTSFNGAPVKLIGFVAGDVDGGFELARYTISCCAADAAPIVVRVLGTSGAPPTRDQWVSVTGTFKPGGGDIPDLIATSVAQIPAPEDPYE